MKPAARQLAAALTGAALAALPLLGAPPARAAPTAARPLAAAAAPGAPTRHGSARGHAAPGRQAAQPARLDVGGARLAGSGVAVSYPARGARPLPNVPAAAYVIADARTGQVLAARDAHGEFPPASTLKVLTAITLIPRLNPAATVAATRQATSVQPNVVGLITGRRYQVSDLFQALLMISANDAAVALAQAAGSLQTGVGLMNAEAQRLRAYDVVARQPNGLPAPGQQVSAYDLALIARQALSIPAFMKYDSTLVARFPVTPRHLVTMVNQNTLLTSYRGGIGGKIGWTARAQATYIGLARRDGVTLIVTLLHCTPLTEITSGERLLDWGFAMAGKAAPVGVLVPPVPAAPAGHPSPSSAAGRGTGPAAGATAGTAAGLAAGSRAGPAPSGLTLAAAARSAPLPAVPLLVGVGLLAAASLALGWFARLRRR